jgi:hypothetical protein
MGDVLGRDAAARPGRIGAPDQPRDRGVDDGDPKPEARPGRWPVPGRGCRGSARRYARAGPGEHSLRPGGERRPCHDASSSAIFSQFSSCSAQRAGHRSGEVLRKDSRAHRRYRPVPAGRRPAHSTTGAMRRSDASLPQRMFLRRGRPNRGSSRPRVVSTSALVDLLPRVRWSAAPARARQGERRPDSEPVKES